MPDLPIKTSFPCESCGAILQFVPGQTKLRCAHCGNEQEIAWPPAGKARHMGEIDLDVGLQQDLPDAITQPQNSTPCPACGALVEFQGAAHAGRCPFCATSLVTGTGTHRRIKPQALVPFMLDEPAARTAMKDWLGSLWFAPNGLAEYARKGRPMQGIYTPYWTFDSATRSHYTGERGDHYYVQKTVTINGKQQTVSEQRTRWTAKRGRVSRFFDDVPVMASTALPRHYMDALEPWDLSRLTPYREDYLAGFTAEGYSVPLADGWQMAQEIMNDVITQDVRHDIGGDVQRIHQIDSEFSNRTFKHILLPVWIAAYKYNDKSYRFVVNGQTGKVTGERPYSIWKIAFAVLCAAALAAAAFYYYDTVQR